MIKNEELLELIEQKKKELSCDNCRHCDLNAYYRGKWYCSEHSVFDDLSDMTNCFEPKN